MNEELAIAKFLALGAGRLGKGFPPLPSGYPPFDIMIAAEIARGKRAHSWPSPGIREQLDEMTRRAFLGAADDKEMVPLSAKPVPVHKPFPDVLGFTDRPTAPLIEWPK